MKKNRRRLLSTIAEPLELRRLLASIASTSPFNGAQKVSPTANITVTFADAMNTTSLTAANLALTDSAGAVVPSTITYSATTKTVTIDPTPTLATSNTYYTLTVKGGATGVLDASGGTLAKDYSLAFTTGTPSFSTQTVFSGINAPTNFEFSPDGRVFVTEKGGIIDVYDNINDPTPTVFADLRTEVHNFWDRGLLGLALDPKFTTGRPYVYALYAYDADIGGVAPKWGQPNVDSDPGGNNPTGVGATISCRLVKLTADGDKMVNEQVLINDWPDQFPGHSIGDIKFGPDGYLYVSGGDGASFNFADYGQVGNPLNDPVNEGGALRSQDVLSPDDPTQLNGTVIRVDPDTGAAAPGNPLTGDANRNRIIAYGLRNPFRITFRPGTSELWVDDTGWDTWEEINRITNVNGSTAPNFGWPAYEGPDIQSGYAALNLPLLQQLYANPSLVTSPYFAYRHADHVDPNGGDPTGSSSSTGLAFYTGSTYPTAYQNALFFSDYSRSEIYVMYAGPNGLPDPSTRQIFPTGTAGAVQIKVGPDGNLYYAELNTGKIVRIVFNSTNAPTAVISADKTSGALPLTINFNAAQSSSPLSGQTLTYAWDLDGDGLFNDSTSVSPSFTYTSAGPRVVGLRVTDSNGLVGTTTLRIVAGNTAPVPVIAFPTSTLHWKVGDQITFTGSATDAEDGVLPESSLVWNAVMVYSNTLDTDAHQDRPLQEWDGVESGTIAGPEWNYPAWLEIRLTATDSAGQSTTKVLRLDPAISNITLASSVTGVPLTLNGNSYTGVKTVLVNSTNTFAAPATYVSNGVTYNFVGWSDGGAITHDIKALATDQTYTATYAAAAPAVIAPSNLVATEVSGKTEAILTWLDNSSNETSFVLERSTSATFATIDVTRIAVAGSAYYNDWGLQRNVTYYYRIRAMANTVASANSNVVTFKLSPPATGAPTAPSGFAIAAGPLNTEAELSWVDNSSNETAFVFQRSTSSTFATIDATRTDRPDSQQYEDWGLTPGATYYYRIRAENGSDVSAWSSTVTFKAPSPPAGIPTAPSGFAITAGPSNSEAELAWKDNATNETAYVFQRSTSATFATIDVTRTDRPDSQQYEDWGLTPGVTYYYRLRAENGSDVSAWSSTVTFTAPKPATAPVQPTGLTVTNVAGSNSQLSLSWTDSAGTASYFVVQRSTSATFDTFTTLGNSYYTGPYVSWGLAASTTYYYRIMAVNDSGQSIYSQIVSGKTTA